MSWGPKSGCAECIAQGGGICPACWRKRERERDIAGERRMHHDTALYNAWVRGELEEDELFRQLEGDKRAVRQLVDHVKALRAGGKGKGEVRTGRMQRMFKPGGNE